MTQAAEVRKSEAIVLRLPESWAGDDAFYELCSKNDTARLERSAEGDLIVMPPAGGETGFRNSRLTRFLDIWAESDGSGVAFDSSTGFRLPNGAVRSPDASWVSRSRLAALTPEQKRRFLPLCPELVIELLSATDVLEETQAKMEEYRDQDALLGWLIAPEQRRVYVYRPGNPVETLEEPATLSGDPEMPGLVLELTSVWTPGF